MRSAAAIREWLVAHVAEMLGVEGAELDCNQPLVEFGLSSRDAVSIAGDLESWLGRTIPPTLFWEHPTIDAIAFSLGTDAAAPVPRAADPVVAPGESIAIIGLACRFPGAPDAGAFWELLRNGGDAISEVPAGRWELPSAVGASSERSWPRWGGFIPGIEDFDAEFFDLSPREAAVTDPQHRLLLELAWHAFEDAGIAETVLAGTATGVFIGVSNNEYAQRFVANAEQRRNPYLLTGNSVSIAANRISYTFDLRGPSVAIDTACSSSLTAVHQACRSLRAGETTLALAGGVNLMLSAFVSGSLGGAGFLAADARCKAFDDAADGYVRGEGAGLVVLKPLSRAVADGDRVYAVIRGTAVNNDGRSNGLTAPSQKAQEAVIWAACHDAAIPPGRLQYVEAHGTGTALGDPIEARALGNVLALDRDPRSRCAVGSVKTNLGHLEAAAGVASLIKVALAIHHRLIPASLHFKNANRHIPFDALPLVVQERLGPWPASGHPLLAGVSSFGFGGTNAHVVLGEAPVPRAAALSETLTDANPRMEVLPLSARSPAALQAVAKLWAAYLEGPGAVVPIGALAASATHRRSSLPDQLLLLGRWHGELIEQIGAFLEGRPHPRVVTGARRLRAGQSRLAVVFSGQGSQWWGMGRDLLADEPTFRSAFERCDEISRGHSGPSLLDELCAPEAASRLDRTDVAQPVLLALQVGLLDWWRSVGVEPQAVVGHSAGEVAAAYAAGMVGLDEAVRLSVVRGRVLQRAAGRGRMAVVSLTLEEAEEAVNGLEGVAVAAWNAPGTSVLSGDVRILSGILSSVSARGRRAQWLAGEYPFHSPRVDDLCEELLASLPALEAHPPSITLFSTVTGRPLQTGDLTPRYFARQLREPVRFCPAIRGFLDAGYDCFLELGPQATLISAIVQVAEEQGRSPLVVSSLRRGAEDRESLLRALAMLRVHGVPTNLRALHPRDSVGLGMPLYPFQRERHWIDPVPAPPAGARDPMRPLVVEWSSAGPRVAVPSPGRSWIVVGDRSGVGAALADAARGMGVDILLIPGGEATAAEVEARLERALATGTPWEAVIDLTALDAAPADMLSFPALLEAQVASGERIVRRMRLLVTSGGDASARLWLVTCGAQPAGPTNGRLAIEQAMVWGLGRGFAGEYPVRWGGLVDLDPDTDAAEAAGAVMRELLAGPTGEVALRKGLRHVPCLVPTAAARERRFRCRPHGTYIVTGGLGGLGLASAEWLVDRGARSILLLGRRLLTSPDAIAILERLRTRGAAIETVAVDVADEGALRSCIADRSGGSPPIRGVLHLAGVSDRRLLADVDEGSLREVLRPKLAALVVEHVLGGQDLDFFVMFSSVAALLAPFAQGAAGYAAANAALDSLAHRRRAMGRPTLAVNWGPWDAVGMAAPYARRFEGWGVRGLMPAVAFEALEELLATRCAQGVVADIDWGEWARRAPPGAPSSMRPGVALAGGSAVPASPGRGRRDVWKLPAPVRAQVIGDALRYGIARALGVRESELDGRRSLAELGVDSLIAMEIRGHLQAELGLEIGMARLLEARTVGELAQFVAAEIDPGATDEQPMAAPPLDQPAPEAAASGLRPLSRGQTALWLHQQVAPDSAAYNLAVTLDLHPDLDSSALRRALQALMDRHPILRSVYVLHDGAPRRREHATLPLSWDEVQLHGADASALSARLLEHALLPFDLELQPPVRATVYTAPGGARSLQIVMHHIAVDFWAIDLLLRELHDTYTGGSTADPALAPASYDAYVRWQEEMIASPQGARHEAYWRERLAGDLPILALPLDHARPRRRRYRGGGQPVRLGIGLSREVRVLARAERTTPYVVLLAAFFSWLARHTGQEDLLVGSPAAGRTRPELLRTIGYLANPLVIRASVHRDTSFRSLVRDVRQTVADAIEHQDYPLPALIERLGLRRDSGYAPLFSAFFVWDKSRQAGSKDLPADAPLRLEALASGQCGAAFDLMFTAFEGPEELTATLQYDVDLFLPETARRMADRFTFLLGGLLESPDESTGVVPLLGESEIALLDAWNATAGPYPDAVGVHRLFEAQAARTPDSVALISGDTSLSYSELNARANALAGDLRARGVSAGRLVGICLGRTVDLVVALLATFKAGGGYVPFDPAFPTERLRHMLEDTRPCVILTDRASRSQLPCEDSAVLYVDDPRPAEIPLLDRTEQSVQDATGDDVAYVLFTSGSTGRPKAVEIRHRSVCNLLTSVSREPGFDATDTLVAISTLSFDISLNELLLPLICGGRLVLADRETVLDGAKLAALIEEHRATVMQATPSTWRMLIARGWQGDGRIRILSTGEALPRDLAEALLDRGGSVWNLYGPTETTIFSGIAKVERGGGPVPIGRPVANTRFDVLDGERRRTPIGVPGELFIGGAGVARGYRGQPDLTAERFLADPTGAPGALRYRTGDLVRYLPDGNLAFLGRADHQVKLHGFRIEPAEIEMTLARHPAVQQSMVVVREDVPGDRTLVAYVVTDAVSPAPGELRAFLAARLPPYMVPSTFVALPSLPLTPTGKVDRGALPAPSHERPALLSTYLAPRTAIEALIAETWQLVLGISRVGVHDDFFELGGSSMRSVEVVARLQQVGIELTPTQIFEYATVATLASIVSVSVSSDPGPRTVGPSARS